MQNDQVLCQYCASPLVPVSQTEVACTKCNVAKLERRIEKLEERTSYITDKQFETTCDLNQLSQNINAKADKWF